MIRKLNQEEINNIAGGMILEHKGDYYVIYTGTDYPEPTEIRFPHLNCTCIIQNGSLLWANKARERVWTNNLKAAQKLDKIVNPQDPTAGLYMQRVLAEDPETHRVTAISAPKLIPLRIAFSKYDISGIDKNFNPY